MKYTLKDIINGNNVKESHDCVEKNIGKLFNDKKIMDIISNDNIYERLNSYIVSVLKNKSVCAVSSETLSQLYNFNSWSSSDPYYITLFKDIININKQGSYTFYDIGSYTGTKCSVTIGDEYFELNYANSVQYTGVFVRGAAPVYPKIVRVAIENKSYFHLDVMKDYYCNQGIYLEKVDDNYVFSCDKDKLNSYLNSHKEHHDENNKEIVQPPKKEHVSLFRVFRK